MDLSVLKDALQGLSTIGKKEKTFEVGGISVTLRTLLPGEEIQIQKLTREILDGEPDNSDVMTFVDAFRRRTLSYSIVAVGDVDFRDVNLVTTDEFLENGVQVSITKPEAVSRLLEDLPRALLAAIYDKYDQLSEEAQRETEEALQLEPTDVEAEIERLTERIEELKISQQESYSDAAVASSMNLAKPEKNVTKSEKRSPVKPPKTQPPALKPSPNPQQEVVSSMIGSDPMEAIQRETERLQRERAKARKGLPAPHLQAKETSEEVFKKEGKIDGVEVFRMPTQNLSVAGTPSTQEGYISSTNPNFKPSK